MVNQTLFPRINICGKNRHLCQVVYDVSFVSKTQLIDHYTKTLGAIHFGGHIMIIDTTAALRHIDKYFKDQE